MSGFDCQYTRWLFSQDISLRLCIRELVSWVRLPKAELTTSQQTRSLPVGAANLPAWDQVVLE